MFAYKTLTDSLVEYLRTAIISGELPGGMRLNEAVIATKLNVSRPPLREALQIIEQQKLIVSASRKGRFVVQLSEENAKVLWQCREMIECYAIRILEQKGIRSIPEIRNNLKETEEIHYPGNDPSRRIDFLSKINKFHQSLVASAENEILTYFYSIIRDNIYRYAYVDMFQTGKPCISVSDHAGIYSYLEAGLYEKAQSALREHINKSAGHINQYLNGQLKK